MPTKIIRKWRTGTKVPINVYDEKGFPVCQCQTAKYAKQIVDAVNQDAPPPESW